MLQPNRWHQIDWFSEKLLAQIEEGAQRTEVTEREAWRRPRELEIRFLPLEDEECESAWGIESGELKLFLISWNFNWIIFIFKCSKKHNSWNSGIFKFFWLIIQKNYFNWKYVNFLQKLYYSLKIEFMQNEITLYIIRDILD